MWSSVITAVQWCRHILLTNRAEQHVYGPRLRLAQKVEMADSFNTIADVG